jgi:hypothetical protein
MGRSSTVGFSVGKAGIRPGLVRNWVWVLGKGISYFLRGLAEKSSFRLRCIG